jgi:hypothetical protein
MRRQHCGRSVACYAEPDADNEGVGVDQDFEMISLREDRTHETSKCSYCGNCVGECKHFAWVTRGPESVPNDSRVVPRNIIGPGMGEAET